MATGSAVLGRYAEEGQETTCRLCGRKLEFREVARDVITDEPVYRWVAVRKSKRAPIPIQCTGRPSGAGPHVGKWHSASGAPVDVP